MLKLESLALELFEYKVEDLRNKRAVRGGASSVWALYNHLVKEVAVLAPDERGRLELAGRTLRRISQSPHGRRKSVQTFADLVLGAPPTAEAPARAAQTARPEGAGLEVEVRPERPTHSTLVEVATDPEVAAEQAALQKLAASVWWHDLDRYVMQFAAALRAERDRFTARLLFALHRNLALYAQQDTYRSDVNLSRFRVVEPIPSLDDPLLSLNDLDSLAELVRETFTLVLELTKPGRAFAGLDLPRAMSLDYVKRAALAVARDPYAGKLGLLAAKGPNSEQLRLAIQELAKERLPEAERLRQRNALEQRLKAALAFERNQQQLFRQDVERFTGLVEALFERIGRHLPRSVGGQAGGPQLRGGVLFAVNPALRWEDVPVGANEVTVKLRGPTRFSLAGTEISVSGPGAGQVLYADGEALPVEAGRSHRVGRGRLLLFKEADYLHLKYEDDTRSLAVMVAEALAVYYVLASDHRDSLLTVLRVLANTVSGESQELIRLALERVAALSAKTPDRRSAVEGFVRGAARAARVSLPEGVILGLVLRFHTAMTVRADDLEGVLDRSEASETAVYPLTDDPLSVDVGTFNVTVRRYRARGGPKQESIVVMLPGQTIGSFTDYLIEPLGAGTLLCVRGDQDLAVLYVQGELLPAESGATHP